MKISGKNIFITGSTRGIGLAIAHEFAKQGANIVLNGRSPISHDILNQFSDYNVKVISVVGDVSDLNVAKHMIATAIDTLGSVDVLINNAGITKDKLLFSMTQEDFESVLDINLTGTFNMTQAALKYMVKSRQGAIINMSSVAGIIGNIGQSNYAASKAGVIGLTKTVAREVANRNVRINVLAPGLIDSDMTMSISEKLKDTMKKNIPMRRFGTVEEVAKAAVFLATQEYITGQVLTIDGGMTM